MTTLDRVIILIVAAILLVISALIGLTTWGNLTLVQWLNSLPATKIDGILVIAIFVLLAVYLVLMRIKPARDQRAIVRGLELGDIRISAQTIVELVSTAVRETHGIKDVLVKLDEVEPVSLTLEMQLVPDVNIPQLSEAVQIHVRDYLQNTVGIEVTRVNVSVSGVKNVPKTQMEQK